MRISCSPRLFVKGTEKSCTKRSTQLCAAALSIGRRLLKVSERLPRHMDNIPNGKGAHVAFSLPVRNRDQHVWSQWRHIRKRLQAAYATQSLAKKKILKSV